MRTTVPYPAGARERALARLHDPTTWVDWIPGLRDVKGTAPALALVFGGPRPFRCAVHCEMPTDGLTFQLEEGEVRTLGGSITVEPSDVHIEIDVLFGPTVPGVLWTSLESDVLPALVGALTAPDVPEGSDRPAD